MNYPLNFASEKEKHDWVVANAIYWTTIRRRNRKYEREEHKTLEDAEKAARVLVKNDPFAQVMIYAVAEHHDTFVKAIRYEAGNLVDEPGHV